MNRKIAMVLVCTALAALVGCSKGNLSKNAESGTYLGIIAFSSDVNQFKNGELMLLKPATRYEAESFIDAQRSDIATVLYHSVNTAIDNIEKYPLPIDLENVSIVTFTDGVDEGSIGMTNGKYKDDKDYAAAVAKRLAKDKIGNLHINAYSIGLKSPIITDLDEFKSGLRDMATTDENCYMVENFEEVKSVFRRIAQSLHTLNTIQSVKLRIPSTSDGKKMRFTFDVPRTEIDSLRELIMDTVNLPTNEQIAAWQQEIRSKAEQSNLYIDAVYKNDGKKQFLTNLEYHGINGTITEIEGTKESTGSLYTFVISGISGSDVDSRKAVEWIMDGGKWAFRDEFRPSNQTETEVVEKSAAIYLVMDCSESLGTNGLVSIKAAAKEFIRTLSGAGSEPVR